jgi:hypothetical protein
MNVVEIEKSIADAFVRTKHYSRKSSIFWKGFALIEDGLIQGVVVYGQPSPQLQKSAFQDRDFRLYELSRLVIQTKSKNAASILVGRSLDMLEKPCAVVSYVDADTEQSHCGIVYQATNWLYTGSTVSHDHLYLVDGVRTHPMTLRDRGITSPKEWARDNDIATVKPMPKHRYFFLNGNKYQKREMLDKLTYQVIGKYPKCDQQRYDDGSVLTFHHKEIA